MITTTNPDANYLKLFSDYYGDVQGYADRPFEEYGGQEIAGFTADQLAAFERARAFSGAGVGQAELDQSRNLITGATDPISGQQIAHYMDPYLDEVLNRNTQDLDRARQIAMLQNANSATRAGAFGGSRHGLVESETNRNYLDAVGRNSANLRSTGYVNAMKNANLHADRALTGAGRLRDLGLSRRSFGQEDIELLNNIGAQQQGLNQDNLTMDRQRWIDQRYYPERMLAIQGSALSGMPYGQTSRASGYEQNTNQVAQAFGGAGLGYNTARSLFPNTGWAGGAGAILGGLGGLLF
jgi:hypothetical protein|tara:strand:+ start:1533 stop:2420 length:888 start_codon:yes stop_codon:yes gene_type:complete